MVDNKSSEILTDFHIFGNDTDNWKLYVWRSKEEIKVGECMMPYLVPVLIV